MKISLFVGATEYVLAHGSAHSVDLHVGPLGDLRLNVTAASQIDPIIGASAVTIQDRGNRQGRMSFSVEVQKATVEDATAYTVTYPCTLPRFGTLTIVDVVTLSGTAHIADISCDQRGLSVTITYSINFGTLAQV